MQNFLSWSPQMAPKGFACLGLEYFCFEGDGLWSSPDEELVALAKREIGHIGLISPTRVVDAEVVRQPKAYPIYDDAYQTHVEAVRDEFQTAYPSLHLVGRNGMHKYNNQDHAMMTAMLTVENILAGARLYDVWRQRRRRIRRGRRLRRAGSVEERAPGAAAGRLAQSPQAQTGADLVCARAARRGRRRSSRPT